MTEASRVSMENRLLCCPGLGAGGEFEKASQAGRSLYRLSIGPEAGGGAIGQADQAERIEYRLSMSEAMGGGKSEKAIRPGQAELPLSVFPEEMEDKIEAARVTSNEDLPESEGVPSE